MVVNMSIVKMPFKSLKSDYICTDSLPVVP